MIIEAENQGREESLGTKLSSLWAVLVWGASEEPNVRYRERSSGKVYRMINPGRHRGRGGDGKDPGHETHGT